MARAPSVASMLKSDRRTGEDRRLPPYGGKPDLDVGGSRNPREGTDRPGSPKNPVPVPPWAKKQSAKRTPPGAPRPKNPIPGKGGPHPPEPIPGPVPKKIPVPGKPKPPFSMGRRSPLSGRVM